MNTVIPRGATDLTPSDWITLYHSFAKASIARSFTSFRMTRQSAE
jgi:hypothetical protein